MRRCLRRTRVASMSVDLSSRIGRRRVKMTVAWYFFGEGRSGKSYICLHNSSVPLRQILRLICTQTRLIWSFFRTWYQSSKFSSPAVRRGQLKAAHCLIMMSKHISKKLEHTTNTVSAISVIFFLESAAVWRWSPTFLTIFFIFRTFKECVHCARTFFPYPLKQPRKAFAEVPRSS